MSHCTLRVPRRLSIQKIDTCKQKGKRKEKKRKRKGKGKYVKEERGGTFQTNNNKKVEVAGIDPAAPRMQSECSTI